MDVFGIALSGMNAANAELSAAASNIANADTPGYKAARANLTDAPDGAGVRVDSVTFDSTPGPTDTNGVEGSNVDLPRELINLDRAKVLYDANAAVVRVGDQMMGSLLDIMDNDPRNANRTHGIFS